ncbi:hypothetical protein NDR87_31385 [Nocardia sp. CDC159]|uniref:Uncharacterized protein n=1 Tax=Nocardia pulmonis TaxID=2951408 RepID=A0A9X2EC08_9NOCA|nr:MULTISPECIES: hypothetical protein [Nocardia]MCM6777947.1 hypothetical protein [Nocardia pulmonis]MCM6790882.1 hypothetical protein [Nocardia sp. CDC159]
MTAILDVAECLLTDSMTEEQLVAFHRQVYGPETVDGAPTTAPAGFDADSELAAFDAFAQMAGDG